MYGSMFFSSYFKNIFKKLNQFEMNKPSRFFIEFKGSLNIEVEYNFYKEYSEVEIIGFLFITGKKRFPANEIIEHIATISNGDYDTFMSNVENTILEYEKNQMDSVREDIFDDIN